MDKAAFTYHYELRDAAGNLKSTWDETNLVPDAGRDYLIANGISGGSWYIGLFTANRAPLADDTMATFIADCAESVAYTTTANARLGMTGATSNGVYSNVLSPATFTFTSAQTIYGGFITSGATRGATSGTLLSVELNASAKTVGNGDTLTVVAGIPVTSI